MTRVIAPGAALGVLGGGQLGRMFAIAARRMGYRVHTFSPDDDTPTGQVADLEVTASYEDLDALRTFARGVDVVTFEFENVPIEAIDAIEALAPVRPSAWRCTPRSSARARRRSSPTAASRRRPSRRAATLDELWDAVARVGTPAVIKTAAFGYDGKGQHKVTTPADVEHIWTAIGHQEAVVEKFINLQAEISIVAARGLDGEIAAFPPFENRHRNHILDLTTAPAAIAAGGGQRGRRDHADDPRGAAVRRRAVRGVLRQHRRRAARERAGAAAAQLRPPDVRRGGDQPVRAAGARDLRPAARVDRSIPRPAAMANLLGDLWVDGEPNWAAACRFTDVKLHLYGKTDPRPGRKMGHLTAVGQDGAGGAGTRDRGARRAADLTVV